jgi:hypothetical protein
VSASRREVRASAAFFEDLDRQLRPERGPNGEPSRTDFQALELLDIVERFATGFDELPPLIEGRTDYRVLMSTGPLVRIYSVIGQLRPDGAVELLALDVDLGTDWG